MKGARRNNDKKEYVSYIWKYVFEMKDVDRLDRILKYVVYEYINDSGRAEEETASAEQVWYEAVLEVILDCALEIENIEMLELVERFARKMKDTGNKGIAKKE